jgi:hypothetical protein
LSELDRELEAIDRLCGYLAHEVPGLSGAYHLMAASYLQELLREKAREAHSKPKDGAA